MKTPNPGRVNLCPICGEDCLPTKLGTLEHKAKHLDWLADHKRHLELAPSERVAAWRAYATELRAYATELEGANARLREDINVFLDRIEDLNAQLDAIHRQEAQQ